MKAAAFLGHTNDDLLPSLITVFRRCHKDVTLCELDDLINLMLMITMSEVHLTDLPVKDQQYLQECIDFIDSKYKNSLQYTAPCGLTLNYFEQITTPQKTYNKEAGHYSDLRFLSEEKRAQHDGIYLSNSADSDSEQTGSEEEVVTGAASPLSVAAEEPPEEVQFDITHRRYRFKPKMSYERLGTEGDFDEDKEFEKYRRTKL